MDDRRSKLQPMSKTLQIERGAVRIADHPFLVQERQAASVDA